MALSVNIIFWKLEAWCAHLHISTQNAFSVPPLFDSSAGLELLEGSVVCDALACAKFSIFHRTVQVTILDGE